MRCPLMCHPVAYQPLFRSQLLSDCINQDASIVPMATSPTGDWSEVSQLIEFNTNTQMEIRALSLFMDMT